MKHSPCMPHRSSTAWPWILVLLALLAHGMSQAGPLGRCATGEAPGLVVLPDGSRHEAISVSICMRSQWTPTVALHEVKIDGRAVALFPSRPGPDEPVFDGATPALLFHRTPSGAHELIGYVWSDGRSSTTFYLHPRRAQRGPSPMELASLDERTPATR